MEKQTYTQLQPGKPWLTGIFKRLPQLGVWALLTATICAFGSLAALAASKGKDIETWPSKKYPLQPTVIVAILSAIANATLRYALAESLTLLWWSKALRGGSLKDLHLSWAYATSFKQSFFSGKQFNTIALACIITTLVSIDGPLLQRSSSVTTVSVVQNATITASLSHDSLPHGYSGGYHVRSSDVTYLKLPFAQVAKAYQSRNDMQLETSGCSGICDTDLLGTGFDVQCSEGSAPYNLTLSITDGHANATTANIGGISFAFNGIEAHASLFNTSVRYKDDPACVGMLRTVDCTFRLATVSYPVTIANGSVTLRPAGDNDTVELHYPGMEYPGMSSFYSTIGGFVLFGRQQFESNITMKPAPPWWSITGNGSMTYTHLNSAEYNNCTITYSNPMPDVRDLMRELAFRASIGLSNSSTVQTVQGTERIDRTVYTLNYYYLVPGVCLIIANVVAILPLFLGWWHLGRNFSMSPLEIAKAFQSPLMTQAGTNEEVNGLLKAVGEKRVRYGAIAVFEPAHGRKPASDIPKNPGQERIWLENEGVLDDNWVVRREHSEQLVTSQQELTPEERSSSQERRSFISVNTNDGQLSQKSSHRRDDRDESRRTSYEPGTFEKKDGNLMLCFAEEEESEILRPKRGIVYR